MKLENNKDRTNLVVQIITIIDEYYDCSFKISNDHCFVILLKLIEQLEAILGVIKDTKQEIALRDILHDISNAMASQDYVLIRDLLHYELRNMLNLLRN